MSTTCQPNAIDFSVGNARLPMASFTIKPIVDHFGPKPYYFNQREAGNCPEANGNYVFDSSRLYAVEIADDPI